MTGRAPAIGLAIALCSWTAWAGARAAPVSGAPVTAVQVTAGPARAAGSGAVDTAATSGPIGARVRDRDGVVIGHVTLLTTDDAGRSVAQVRRGVDVFSIPLSQIVTHGGEGVSAIAAGDLKPDTEGRSH